MAPSSGIFVLEGVKLSIELLKEISGDLPPPTSTVVGLVQQIIAIVEAIKDNQEQCQLLMDRLIRLLLVVLAALKQQTTGIQGQSEIPQDLLLKVNHFKDNLERILKDVAKIQSIVNSGRKRDKLRATVLAGSYKADLKKCYDQLEWAIKEFDVASRLFDAIRLCKVARQVQKVLTNQYLEKLPIAKYARFDCERPDRPSSCFPGTREAIIKEIIAWITDPDPQAERFFWLNGLAGIGKTTIARTVAELARSLGLLGASFFFSRRGEVELRNPALVFPTIAHQLALFDRDFCERITAAIEADAQAPSASLKQQLDRLIIEPLRGLERDPERVVIILFDAFDECEAVGANTILQLFVAAIPSLPFFLKVFVTSRPEQHIRSVLVPSTDKLRITALHDVEAIVVKSDILIYLRASIRSLPVKKGLVVRSDWVTDGEIELLAKAAGKLFIWAATAFRSLEEAYSLPRQLKILLRLAAAPRSEQDESNPFVYLDELYTEVLCEPITPANKVQALDMLQVVLGSIVLIRNPLPVDALERLVDMESGEVLATLNRLHSVILPPAPPDHCPRTYHPSFPDYLQDPARCKPDTGLFIDTQKHEARMTLCCLALLNEKLHKGMLGNLGSVILNSEVEELEKKVDAAYLPDLQYACRFWASHLVKVSLPEAEGIGVALALFASRGLLSWLESMSWMGQTREAVDCLEIANTWVAKSSSSSVTALLINDAYRLLLAHFPIITESALHIARSALPFAPRNTQLRTTYAEYADVTVVLGHTELEWSPCLMTIARDLNNRVGAVAFSPDGTRIVSGSIVNGKDVHIYDASSGSSIMVLASDSTWVRTVMWSQDGQRVASAASYYIQVWDANTGHELLKLRGPSELFCSIAFAPDGSRIACGSLDSIIRVCDGVTGDILMALAGHSGSVNSVGFFPDGRRLVSGSDDRTVRIWDLANRTCITHLIGHSKGVCSVAVSLDGSRIASGSSDCTIRVWDVSNGATLATLQGHTGTVLSVAFSSSGDRIVSGSGDKSVRLWNAATADNVATFCEHTDDIPSVAFSLDGRRVVSGSDDATVRIWDVNAFTETGSRGPERHSEVRSVSLPRADYNQMGSGRGVHCLAFSSDGNQLALLDPCNDVKVWNIVEDRSIASFRGHRGHGMTMERGWSVHFSQGDTQIIVAHTYHPSATYDASNGDLIAEEGVLALDAGSLNPALFKVEDRTLVRNDVSPATVVCLIPRSLRWGVSAIASFKLGGGLGDRVALGFRDGWVMVLDVVR